MKLISMTDFVIEQKITETFDTPQIMWYDSEVNKLDKIRTYANFLKQPLELWMFVPCDEDGNVLEKPKGTDLNSSFFEMQEDYNLEVKYEIAKEKCLFEDCELMDGWCIHLSDGTLFAGIDKLSGYTVEDLTHYKPLLTQTAIKQLEL